MNVDGAKEHWPRDEKGPCVCPSYLSECHKEIGKRPCQRPFNINTVLSGKEQTDLGYRKTCQPHAKPFHKSDSTVRSFWR